MTEEYEVIPTENYSEDLTFGDVALLSVLGFIACVVICFLFKQIKATFKNVHLKVGKLEIGVETKEEKEEKK